MPQNVSNLADLQAAARAQVQELNRLAQDADAQLRAALQARDPATAERWRQQRDAYNARASVLTAWLANPSSPPPDGLVTIHSTMSTDAFIQNLADQFNASGGNQDLAHNAILKELLNGKYSAANIALTDPNARAYTVVRENVSAPLYWIRNQQQADTNFAALPPAGNVERARFPRLNLAGKRVGKNFFIRDFMQVLSAGNLSIANTIAVDDTVYAPFANDFNRLVSSINSYQQQQGRSHRVLPYLSMAHRDAFQLIPERTADGINQFGGAIMANVNLSGNVVYSDGALQGIFASDGAFRNLHIRNNHLQIGGKHTITISGMLSGSISGNTDIQGQPLAEDKITLYPLRIGGGANIYVLSFYNKPNILPGDPRHYAYEPIAGVPAARDFRQQFSAAGSVRYQGVDMVELHALIRRHNPQTPIQWLDVMAELARKGFAQPA